MQIFSDPKITEALQKYVADIADQDFIIVDLEQPDERGHRSSAIGMNLVPMLAATNPATPVVIVGWQPVEEYAKDPRWANVTSFRNVILRRLPINKEDILSAIAEVKARLQG